MLQWGHLPLQDCQRPVWHADGKAERVQTGIPATSWTWVNLVTAGKPLCQLWINKELKMAQISVYIFKLPIEYLGTISANNWP